MRQKRKKTKLGKDMNWNKDMKKRIFKSDYDSSMHNKFLRECIAYAIFHSHSLSLFLLFTHVFMWNVFWCGNVIKVVQTYMQQYFDSMQVKSRVKVTPTKWLWLMHTQTDWDFQNKFNNFRLAFSHIHTIFSFHTN